MNDLEMIKAFAKLEGAVATNIIESPDGVEVRFNRNGFLPYNPITDLALNCAARDKYKVTIEYSKSPFCSIGIGTECIYVDIEDESKVSFDVIECILKSEGLWK